MKSEAFTEIIFFESNFLLNWVISSSTSWLGFPLSRYATKLERCKLTCASSESREVPQNLFADSLDNLTLLEENANCPICLVAYWLMEGEGGPSYLPRENKANYGLLDSQGIRITIILTMGPTAVLLRSPRLSWTFIDLWIWVALKPLSHSLKLPSNWPKVVHSGITISFSLISEVFQ